MKKYCLILMTIAVYFSMLTTQAQTPYEGMPKEFILNSASEMNALDWVNMSYGTYKNPKKSTGFDQRGSTHQVITLKADDVNACMSYRYKGGEENMIVADADKAYLQTLPNIADWDTAKDGTLRALRLGDDINNNPVASQITYSFKPDEERNVLTVYFAFVAAGPHHYYMENPLFNIEILKADNTPINTDDPKKSYFLVNPKGQSINENPLAHNEILMAHDKYYVCKSGDGIDHSDIHWIDWTPVAFNLHDYIGEEIQLRITTTDCMLRGHFAYGYFVVRSFNANEEKINVISCSNEQIHLAVPSDFASYEWKVNDVTVDATTHELFMDRNINDTIVTCIARAVNGTDMTFSTIIHYYEIEADYTWLLEDTADGYHVAFTNTSQLQTWDGEELATQDIQYVTWDFGDETPVSTEINPSHTYARSGIYTVTLTLYDNENRCFDIKEEVLKLGSDTLALKEYADIENRVKLYPNPASTQLFIVSESEIEYIEILNANGQVITTRQCSDLKEETIDVTSYSTGFYLMKIKNKTGVVTKKFIVQ